MVALETGLVDTETSAKKKVLLKKVGSYKVINHVATVQCSPIMPNEISYLAIIQNKALLQKNSYNAAN